jgi:pentatricopeptide repeat protein
MDTLDASTLQLITLGYLDPNSEKAKRHVKGLEKELMSERGLFYRYRHHDDFGVPTTEFLICSFWYIEVLTMMGRLDEAIELFDRMLKFTNHLGLLSEDVDASNGSQWGNFPQTYSHVGQINAAYRIARKIDRPNFL